MLILPFQLNLTSKLWLDQNCNDYVFLFLKTNCRTKLGSFSSNLFIQLTLKFKRGRQCLEMRGTKKRKKNVKNLKLSIEVEEKELLKDRCEPQGYCKNVAIQMPRTWQKKTVIKSIVISKTMIKTSSKNDYYKKLVKQ